MTVTLYSIGHSNGTAEHLIALLQQHAIVNLCDVRSVPYSRYNPQFNREALMPVLRSHAIRYWYLGKQLGGKPQYDPALLADAEALALVQARERVAFERGIAQLIALGRSAPTAFMCSEADYRHCHRHHLISPALLAQQVQVWHVLADGRLERGEAMLHQTSMFL
jgi:uncharacterized protein (DUF488 family)